MGTGSEAQRIPLEQDRAARPSRVIWAVADDCAIVLAVLCTHDQGLMDASRTRAQVYRVPTSLKEGRPVKDELRQSPARPDESPSLRRS